MSMFLVAAFHKVPLSKFCIHLISHIKQTSNKPSFQARRFRVLVYHMILSMQLLLTALPTAWCKQYVEVMFAVLTALKLIEDSFWESSETLCTTAKTTVAFFTMFI
jgi:hypothetical protein